MTKTITLLAFVFLFLFKMNAQGQNGWTELGGANSLGANNGIYTIYTDANGNVYSAGGFKNSSGKFYVAKWDGTAWSELGGLNGLAADSIIGIIWGDNNGNLYVGGDFKDSLGKRYVAKWNGTAWSELGGANGLNANGLIYSICCDSFGNVYAAGDFTNSNNNKYVAKWDGTAWSELGGTNSLMANCTIFSIYSDVNGNIYAAGLFTNGSSNANGNKYVAKWDKSNNTWSELGGLNGLAANGPIISICTDATGNIYAAGEFTNNNNEYYIAKWNGVVWSEVGHNNGTTANFTIEAICIDSSGNIYAAGGQFNAWRNYFVSKWNGTTWSELGGNNGINVDSVIYTLYCDASGNVYAGGTFINSMGNYYVAKYTPSICVSAPIAFFSLSPDTNMAHHWYALNQCTGASPLTYSWSWGDASFNDTGRTPSHIYSTAGSYKVCVTISEANGCSNTYCDSSYLSRLNSTNSIVTINVVNQLPTASGIQTLTENIINIAPNPTNTTTTITLTKPVDNATIKLINLTGQTILSTQKQSGDHFNFDISQQAQGIYFVEIRQADNVWRSKIVKQ